MIRLGLIEGSCPIRLGGFIGFREKSNISWILIIFGGLREYKLLKEKGRC